MVQLDEGIGNLQQFCSTLQETSGRVGDLVSAMDAAGGELRDAASEAGDRLGGLADDLEEGGDEVEQAAAEAGEAIEALGEQAAQLSDDRLPDAGEGFEQAAGDCVEQAQQSLAGLDVGFAALTETGFEPFAEALREAVDQLGETDAASQEAFDALESGLDEQGGRLEQARGETSAAVENAAEEAGSEAGDLETAFDTLIEEWHQQIDERLRDGCEELGAQVEDAYSTWGDEASGVAEALMKAVDEAFEQSAAVVGVDLASALEEAERAGLDDPSAGVCAALETVQRTADDGERVCQELQGLVPGLETSLDVVDEVDRLLNALE